MNGQHLDPLSYLIHGLSSRFGPLDDEVRLRSAQDLLSFSRRTGESTDTVLSRFDIVRQRARADGGGATVSTETAALILLRAVGANHTQFQQLTQPFGYWLPSTEQEFLHMTSAIRRLGHIVESHRDNIAIRGRIITGQVRPPVMRQARTKKMAKKLTVPMQVETGPTSRTMVSRTQTVPHPATTTR